MPQDFITCVFKLHTPSARRRQALDKIFHQYTLEFSNLLDWSRENLEQIKENGIYRQLDDEGNVKSEKYTDKSIAQILPKPSSLEAQISSCLKEALVKNVSAGLASYLELEKSDSQEAGFPLGRDPSPQGWPNALEEFCIVGNDLIEENEARARLLTVAKSAYMPIQYSRSRDFYLLTNVDQTRFFVLLKLLTGSETSQKTVITDLINIADGEPFTYNGKAALLFPVELGQRDNQWHWQYHRFIKPTLEGELFIKAGKLVKKDNDYFLHVSFGYEVQKPFDPLSYMGVTLGINPSACWSIVDMDGNIVELGHSADLFAQIRIRATRRVQKLQKKFVKITRRDYRPKELDGILHKIANQILDKAVEHQSCLVFEDIRKHIDGPFYKSATEKLIDLILYKARAKGVPIYGLRKGQVYGMWSAYAANICPTCGALDKAQPVAGFYNCTCGANWMAGQSKAINLARRVFYRKADWPSENGKGDYLAFHRSFANVAGF